MMIRGDGMKITDREIAVIELLSVYDGTFRTDRGGSSCRDSDGFVLVLSGQARYDFEDHSFTAGPGDVLYLAQSSRYSVAVTQRTYRWVCVNFRFSHPENGMLESDVFHPGGGKAMENAFQKLLNLWREGDFSDKLLCRAIIYEIYAAIIKATTTESLAAGQAERLQSVLAYIRSHYADPDLSVEQLAELFQSSPVHFRRTFARLYHTSPLKFITGLRLSRAKELLQSTDLPVGEICRQCGYTSVYYFDRVFKKEFGLQPTQFRKTCLL